VGVLLYGAGRGGRPRRHLRQVREASPGFSSVGILADRLL